MDTVIYNYDDRKKFLQREFNADEEREFFANGTLTVSINYIGNTISVCGWQILTTKPHEAYGYIHDKVSNTCMGLSDLTHIMVDAESIFSMTDEEYKATDKFKGTVRELIYRTYDDGTPAVYYDPYNDRTYPSIESILGGISG